MRVVFIGESGTDALGVLLELGLQDPQARAKAVQFAREYLEQQWVGERDPDLYGPYYDRGVAALDAFAVADTSMLDGAVQPQEYHTVTISVEYGWLFLTT